MKKYRVRYQYRADTQDLGVVEAVNADEAKAVAAFRRHPADRDLEMWTRCLSSAKEVIDSMSKVRQAMGLPQ